MVTCSRLRSYSPPRNESHHHGDVCRFEDGVVVVGGAAVVSVEGVDQGARHRALWRTVAEVEGRRCVRSHSDPLTGGVRKLLIHTQVGRGDPGPPVCPSVREGGSCPTQSCNPPKAAARSSSVAPGGRMRRGGLWLWRPLWICLSCGQTGGGWWEE